MRNLLACFCFDEGMLTGAKIAELIRETVRFRTPHIITDDFLKNGGKYQPDQHLRNIELSQDIKSVRLGLASFEGQYFDVGGPSVWGFQTVTWCCEPEDLPDQKFFDQLSLWPGFSAGYISDAEDVQWQSETLPSNYELFGRSHKELPKCWDDEFEDERIDTLRNPGARHPIPGMWLQAAWKMWFGPGAFRFIPVERLMAFEEADRIERLEDRSIFIQLYSDPSDFDSEVSRARQASFNTCVGKASLVAQGTDLDPAPSDPSHEIEHGKFDHGGATRLTVWLDENDKPVIRSKATNCVIQELDDESNVIWTERKAIG
jgi:hypothetical protein